MILATQQFLGRWDGFPVTTIPYSHTRCVGYDGRRKKAVMPSHMSRRAVLAGVVLAFAGSSGAKAQSEADIRRALVGTWVWASTMNGQQVYNELFRPAAATSPIRRPTRRATSSPRPASGAIRAAMSASGRHGQTSRTPRGAISYWARSRSSMSVPTMAHPRRSSAKEKLKSEAITKVSGSFGQFSCFRDKTVTPYSAETRPRFRRNRGV